VQDPSSALRWLRQGGATLWRLFGKGPITATALALLSAFVIAHQRPSIAVPVESSQSKIEAPKLFEGVAIFDLAANIDVCLAAKECRHQKFVGGSEIFRRSGENDSLRTQNVYAQFLQIGSGFRHAFYGSYGILSEDLVPSTKIVSWRLPGVFESETNNNRIIIDHQITRINGNIRAQLALCGIFCATAIWDSAALACRLASFTALVLAMKALYAM
jgi:hypothetical protein